MNDGNPNHNRIPEASNFHIREINKDALNAFLDKCEDSLGCKGLIAAMGESYFATNPPFTLDGFRRHINRTISLMYMRREIQAREMSVALQSRGEKLSQKGIELISMILISETLGKDIDFDTTLYILDILDHSNWADFESIFSQIDPVPLNNDLGTETQPIVIPAEVQNVLNQLDLDTTVAIERTPTENHNIKVTYPSMEVILKRILLPPEISLFILATLKEAMKITSGSEILIDSLQALVLEKLAHIRMYINDVSKSVTEGGVTVDRSIMKIILREAFKKHIPSEFERDPRYRGLVKIINGGDGLEYAFGRIRGQYRLMDHLEETQPIIPIKVELSGIDTKDIREQ
jgi:hypothetical protein